MQNQTDFFEPIILQVLRFVNHKNHIIMKQTLRSACVVLLISLRS